jgi:hypothetical protein
MNGEIIIVFEILVGKPEGKGRGHVNGNIKMLFRE